MIHRRFPFSAAFVTLAMGCSTPATPSTTEDTGSPDEDTSGGDTSVTPDAPGDSGTDTSKPDSGGTDATDTGSPGDGGDATTDSTPTDSVSDTGADTGPEKCTTPGASMSGDCGKCGKRERLCGTDKTWLPWGACSGQTGVCAPKDTRGITCGKCGTRTDTCNSTCDWDLGVCAGEGYCNLGDMEVQYACSVAKYVKIRTCTDKCVWSDWSACGPTKGWDTVADPPSTIAGRYAASGVWSGTEALIWGGNCSGAACGDGAAYRVSSDTWSVISPTGAPAARYWHTAVWTGTEMVVWGGSTNAASSYAYGVNTGGAYNPSTNTWRTLGGSPPSARSGHSAIFVGGKMVIFGGQNTGGTSLNDAATLSISGTTDTWATVSSPGIDARFFAIPMASGSSGGTATFMNGSSNSASPSYYARADGATFDPSTGSWTTITAPSSTIMTYPTKAYGSAWFGNGKVHVWGGAYYYGGIGSPYYIATPSSATSYCNSSYAQATGGVYDVATSTWTSMASSGAPTARCLQTTVWTGTEAIIFGGYYSSWLRDAKIYRP